MSVIRAEQIVHESSCRDVIKLVQCCLSQIGEVVGLEEVPWQEVRDIHIFGKKRWVKSCSFPNLRNKQASLF